ncbi:UDP-N-acetylmuramate dehydrogenase [Corynebacterium kalidii]|uniref:UDP-N-acetylenolpyruvoylglucosamine reductase n=1 Tax=Corynebacterium kalidii TaxID=2931982 RepID=A0A9X1WHW9_9CORY|nr:UDP-N-acetylmuramate dehydrogenase [Corynebacterium kalidii]
MARLTERADVGTSVRSFTELTTLRVGGTPSVVLSCRSQSAVAEVVGTLDAGDVPLLVVGGGSNLVVGEDVPGLVAVVLEAPGGAEDDGLLEIDRGTGVVRAFAGLVWDDVVAATVDAGLGGLECLSGIPGSVGATPVQNVGAYGAEVSQTLRRVQLFDRTTGQTSWVGPEALDLAYRYSNLKFTSRAVVTAVEFQLTTDGLSAPLRFGELARRLGVGAGEAAGDGDARRPVRQVRETVLELRRGKGMVLDPDDHDTWSAGSFFTNPVVDAAVADEVQRIVGTTRGAEDAAGMPRFPAGGPDDGREKLSAAWLIERAGFTRGWHVPGNDRAGLSTKHTLALTNRGSATSSDIVGLARAVRDGVRDTFGVTLVPEPVWVGVALDPE